MHHSGKPKEKNNLSLNTWRIQYWPRSFENQYLHLISIISDKLFATFLELYIEYIVFKLRAKHISTVNQIVYSKVEKAAPWLWVKEANIDVQNLSWPHLLQLRHLQLQLFQLGDGGSGKSDSCWLQLETPNVYCFLSLSLLLIPENWSILILLVLFSFFFMHTCRSSGINYVSTYILSSLPSALWLSSMVATHNGWTSPDHFLRPRHLWLFRQRLAQDTPQRGHVEP